MSRGPRVAPEPFALRAAAEGGSPCWDVSVWETGLRSEGTASPGPRGLQGDLAACSGLCSPPHTTSGRLKRSVAPFCPQSSRGCPPPSDQTPGPGNGLQGLCPRPQPPPPHISHSPDSRTLRSSRLPSSSVCRGLGQGTAALTFFTWSLGCLGFAQVSL